MHSFGKDVLQAHNHEKGVQVSTLGPGIQVYIFEEPGFNALSFSQAGTSVE